MQKKQAPKSKEKSQPDKSTHDGDSEEFCFAQMQKAGMITVHF
jgi:hypothetical protein